MRNKQSEFVQRREKNKNKITVLLLGLRRSWSFSPQDTVEQAREPVHRKI